jgi:uncharacterized protein YqgC (DUF456 family)
MGFTVSPAVWETLVALGVVLFAWIGVLLTALTLPGIWVAIAAAGVAQWWSLASRGAGGAGSAAGTPAVPMFSWWTLGVCVALGLLAELVELLASAMGARKMGGSRRGAVGSVAGALLGALLGTFLIPVPVLGSVLGAAVGAGAGALLTERHLGEKTWAQSGRIGAGAAVGRLVASLAKVAFAALIALVLSVAAFL